MTYHRLDVEILKNIESVLKDFEPLFKNRTHLLECALRHFLAHLKNESEPEKFKNVLEKKLSVLRETNFYKNSSNQRKKILELLEIDSSREQILENLR